MIGIHQFVCMLCCHLNIMFPHFKCKIYASRRCEYVHLCLDEPFWNVKDHDSIIEQIRNFKVHGYDVTETHKYVFPTQIAATRWKHDYIIFKKK